MLKKFSWIVGMLGLLSIFIFYLAINKFVYLISVKDLLILLLISSLISIPNILNSDFSLREKLNWVLDIYILSAALYYTLDICYIISAANNYSDLTTISRPIISFIVILLSILIIKRIFLINSKNTQI